MKILKKILIVFIVSIMFLYSIIPSVYALTQQEAGQAISDFARNSVENHSSEFVYDYGNWTSQGYDRLNYGREEAYYGRKVTGTVYDSYGASTAVEDKYAVDCVGYVDFVLHHSLGLNGDAGTTFVTPQSGIKTPDFDKLYIGKSDLQPGDILVKNGHVMIYIGNNQVAESSDYGDLNGLNIRNYIPDYNYVARVKSEAVANISTVNTSGLPGSATSTVTVKPADASERYEDPSALINPIGTIQTALAENKYITHTEMDVGEIDGLGNSKNFYYNGTPKEGEYLGKSKKENWLFSTLEDAADWLIGILTMNVKIQAVGWATIFENLANNFIEAVTVADIETKVTVEDVIYNRVPVLDVNIFSDTAGGEPLTSAEDAAEDLGIISIFRKNISSIYVMLREIAIILLLFTLIYLGIRTAISSVASERAEYKQKLIGWLVSFIVVMCIHYFMVIILNLNDTAVGWVTPESNVSSVYETVRAHAYEVPATKGWTGTIIYVFLVYFLIKMLYYYFKRLLIIYVLIIIAPVMGVVYSFQRINGKSQTLSLWIKDFTFNVFIQFAHAFMYSVLMGITVQFTTTAKIENVLPLSIVLFALLNFILNADKIITTIFGIKAPSLKNVLDSALRLGSKLAPAYFVWRNFASPLAKTGIENAYDKHLTTALNNKYDKLKLTGDSDIAKATNEQIEKLKKQEFEHVKELDSSAVKFAKQEFDGAVKMVTGVPTMFETPMVGGLIYGSTLLDNTFLDNPIGKGKSGKKARKLEANTEGEEYIYIDDPRGGTRRTNTNQVRTKSRYGSQPRRGINQSDNTVTNSQHNNNSGRRTIRSYNTSKIHKYTLERGVLSWSTVGKSTVIRKTFETAIEENEIIERVYRTRIEKISTIGNMAIHEVKAIDAVTTKMKVENKVPIYYEPQANETQTEVKMNETLRKKYRNVLEKNIKQVYNGTDSKKIQERVVDKIDKKVTLKTVEEIAKDYAKKTETTLGEDFKTNLDERIEDKVIDTIINNEGGFEKLKLKPEIQEKIEKAVENNIENDNLDRDKLKQEVKEILTDDVKDEIVSKISVKDLTELITSTLDTKGSLKVNDNFVELVQPVENLRMLNEEAKITTGSEIYTTDQLIDLIMNKDLRE